MKSLPVHEVTILDLLKEYAQQSGHELCFCKTCGDPFVLGGSSHANKDYCIAHAGRSLAYGNRHKYHAQQREYYRDYYYRKKREREQNEKEKTEGAD